MQAYFCLDIQTKVFVFVLFNPSSLSLVLKLQSRKTYHFTFKINLFINNIGLHNKIMKLPTAYNFSLNQSTFYNNCTYHLIFSVGRNSYILIFGKLNRTVTAQKSAQEYLTYFQVGYLSLQETRSSKYEVQRIICLYIYARIGLSFHIGLNIIQA